VTFVSGAAPRHAPPPPSADHPPLGRADAEELRPLGPGVGRRHRDERETADRRDGLRQVDRATPAHRQQDVHAARLVRDLFDTLTRALAPPPGHGKAEVRPALARDQKRLRDPQLGQEARKLAEPPAHDHERRPFANSTNASAARVGERPAARTSETSRAGSSPFTRAVASVPAARSASIAAREMKVTPKPATTAALTDSCRPSSSRASSSRSLVPALRSSSSITWRTPAPSCITINASSRSSSSVTARSANRCPG